MIDKILYLQRYAEGWENGKFTEKFDYRECVDKPRSVPLTCDQTLSL